MEFLARSGVLSFSLALSLGCTVYTQCPRDTDDDGANTGGTNGGGTNGNGGQAGGMGGSGAGSWPVPEDPWTNATRNLTELDSECGNLTVIAPKPYEDVVLAGVAAVGIFASSGADEDWTRLGQGEGSDVILNRTHAILFDPDDPDKFWQSGSYNGPGIFVTSDDGDTFEAVGTLTHLDFLSIDFTDPERRTMLASGHENGLIYRSTDGGETWEDFTESLAPDANVCVSAYVVDATTYITGCLAFGDELPGLFRTEDAGASWERVSEAPAAFSLPRIAPDGALYWPGDNAGGIAKSTDQGKTWTQVSAPGAVYGYPVILPDGRLAAVAQDNSVAVSPDDGKTWVPVTSQAPFRPIGLAYAPFRKTFYVWHNDCGGKVLSDGVMAYEYDYEEE